MLSFSKNLHYGKRAELYLCLTFHSVTSIYYHIDDEEDEEYKKKDATSEARPDYFHIFNM